MITHGDGHIGVPLGESTTYMIAGCGLVVFVIGMIGFLIHPDILSALVFVPFALPPSMIAFYMVLEYELVRRPRTIVIEDPLHLTFRTRDPMDVPLDHIEWVSIHPGDSSTLLGRMGQSGAIKVQGVKRFTPLSYEIAQDIRDLYRERLGRDPPHPPRRD